MSNWKPKRALTSFILTSTTNSLPTLAEDEAGCRKTLASFSTTGSGLAGGALVQLTIIRHNIPTRTKVRYFLIFTPPNIRLDFTDKLSLMKIGLLLFKAFQLYAQN